MPITTRWYNKEQTAVYVGFGDPWTISDLSVAIRESRALMNSVDHEVDAIWDGSATKGIPQNVLSHFMMPNEDTVIPDNQRNVIVVINGRFLLTFVSTAKRLMPRITQRMHITASMHDADQKLIALRV